MPRTRSLSDKNDASSEGINSGLSIDGIPSRGGPPWKILSVGIELLLRSKSLYLSNENEVRDINTANEINKRV